VYGGVEMDVEEVKTNKKERGIEEEHRKKSRISFGHQWVVPSKLAHILPMP
jgi:hypothetical protein